MNAWPRLARVGDAALAVEFEERIDETVNRAGQLVAAAVADKGVAGVLDVVPAFRSVTVYFDPLATDADRLGDMLMTEARRLRDAPIAGPRAGRRIHQVPVRYGGEHGPDLGAVAAWAKLSEDEVVARHANRDYQVFMLGFTPGFAYLGLVDEGIAMPRLTNPRVRVPAGSVAIAGRQTGIYPSDTPGGWRIIGRTDVVVFDIAGDEPFLFAPGDIVRFLRV